MHLANDETHSRTAKSYLRFRVAVSPEKAQDRNGEMFFLWLLESGMVWRRRSVTCFDCGLGRWVQSL